MAQGNTRSYKQHGMSWNSHGGTMIKILPLNFLGV